MRYCRIGPSPVSGFSPERKLVALGFYVIKARLSCRLMIWFLYLPKKQMIRSARGIWSACGKKTDIQHCVFAIHRRKIERHFDLIRNMVRPDIRIPEVQIRGLDDALFGRLRLLADVQLVVNAGQDDVVGQLQVQDNTVFLTALDGARRAIGFGSLFLLQCPAASLQKYGFRYTSSLL